MRAMRVAALSAVAVLLVSALVNSLEPAGSSEPASGPQTDFQALSYRIPSGIHRIRHVVIIMQENRSFDNYFGTYPGAAGIPMRNGRPAVCVPDPKRHKCVRPYHDRHDYNYGGPHGVTANRADIASGRMDGFIGAQERDMARCRCGTVTPPDDVVGYHTGKDIPNYWAYARDFVLQDHMFQSEGSGSLDSHLFLVSLWSAHCTTHNDPASCRNSLRPGTPPGWGPHPTSRSPIYAWTDLTYLLHKHHVSWRYYIFKGTEPDCESNPTLSCRPVTQGPISSPLWYPLSYFDTVRKDRQRGDIESLKSFFTAAARGRLPAVSWIMPNQRVSEHPFLSLVSQGQTYVTGLINTIMQSPQWKSTAIFVTWDDWGGFYDHLRPPRVDQNGYGLQVPALVISPYAKHHYIDHQTLSFDAYAKFIEDDFLGGQRLDPATDGRRDPRPSVREDAPHLGSLINDFDFKRRPRKPVLLPVHPQTDLINR